MFWRSRKLDCFRYSFARFVLGSIFLIGCLLLLAVFCDSRRSHKTSTHRPRHRTLDVSTTESYLPPLNPNSLLFIRTESGSSLDYGDNSNFVNSWLEEDFPEIKATPSVSSIMETFRKKVALNNRKLINPHDFIYIHNIPEACDSRKVEIVVGIPSRAGNFEARQVMRETWGQYGNDPSNNAIVLFFLGVKDNPVTQEKIDAEVLRYGDIIQENFVDSYRNLSLKTVALLKWVSLFCLNSTFVLKADDDTYVNMPRLLTKLREQMTRGPMFIMGSVHHNTEPFRDQKNKWYVSREDYHFKFFPNYVSGSAYAMSSTAALRLYVESLYIKNFFLEDVYITGLVADRAAVPRVGEAEFSWAKLEPYGCIFKYKISGHKNSPRELRKIHQELSDPSLQCY